MDAKAVRQSIKAAKEKKGLTREELAALIDFSTTHISVIERGTKIPRPVTFAAIANVLEISSDSLPVDVLEYSAAVVASELPAAIERLLLLGRSAHESVGQSLVIAGEILKAAA